VEYGLTDLGTEFQPAIAAIVAIGHKIKQRQAAHGQSDDIAMPAS
jgi:DNA-binding HxlR family transcriptional regulator